MPMTSDLYRRQSPAYSKYNFFNQNVMYWLIEDLMSKVRIINYRG